MKKKKVKEKLVERRWKEKSLERSNRETIKTLWPGSSRAETWGEEQEKRLKNFSPSPELTVHLLTVW
jgi:hypothetical protein